MIFWHVGATLFLFRWIFGDPKVDVRFLIAGSLLPDVIDMTLGTVILAERFHSGELYAHTLLGPTVATTVILLATRRGRRRRAWMALAVGWFFHLLLDGMWASADLFFWPFFGSTFPSGPDPYWSGLVARAFSDPWRWLRGVVGLGYLVRLWISTGLNEPFARARFIESGRIVERSVEPA